MLSKAELLYVQGQKQVSKSYERKLKCLIRKKIEVLQKELPLLSKLSEKNRMNLIDNSMSSNTKPAHVKDDNEDQTFFPKRQGQPTANSSATKFGNLEATESIFLNEAIVAREGLEGLKNSSQQQDVEEATIFSNTETKCATKSSNFDEKRRRERDLNPRGPHGPQAIQLPNFQACALPG